jgi:hypothetical protein
MPKASMELANLDENECVTNGIHEWMCDVFYMKGYIADNIIEDKLEMQLNENDLDNLENVLQNSNSQTRYFCEMDDLSGKEYYVSDILDAIKECRKKINEAYTIYYVYN